MVIPAVFFIEGHYDCWEYMFQLSEKNQFHKTPDQNVLERPVNMILILVNYTYNTHNNNNPNHGHCHQHHHRRSVHHHQSIITSA